MRTLKGRSQRQFDAFVSKHSSVPTVLKVASPVLHRLFHPVEAFCAQVAKQVEHDGLIQDLAHSQIEVSGIFDEGLNVEHQLIIRGIIVRDDVFKWIIVYGRDVPRGDAQLAIVGEALSGRHSCIAFRVTRYGLCLVIIWKYEIFL